jgi:flavin reductase (DIM6/NTAB) family NADH-FMN oxidoreductase RutF
MKAKKNPWAALYPCPVILVTCQDTVGKPNIITLAWTGVVCSDPPTLSISLRPQRYSYKLIDDTQEFVANVPTVDILHSTDYCGMVSGRNVDKFSETGLTPKPAEKVKPPIIQECPVNMECKVKQKILLGVHYMFISEIIHVHVNQMFLDKNKSIDFSKLSPFVYNQGEYWSLKEKIGVHGFSQH